MNLKKKLTPAGILTLFLYTLSLYGCIYLRSQVSVYRTIGPLVFVITAAGVVPCGGPKNLPVHHP